MEPPKPTRRRPDTVPKVETDKGKAGRERAQREVKEALVETTKELTAALDDLSASLATSTSETEKPASTRRRRTTRGGRSASQMSTVKTDEVQTGGGSLSGSALGTGDLLAVESLSLVETGGSSPGGGGGEPGGVDGGGSALRSNASLLAVVRRYAAGIQYCYENELKRDAGLAGKVVVAITIAAAGNVLNATIVEDTVGSDGMVSCAMAQINEWKFPKIDDGVVTFRAPFVFTPPKK